MLTPRVALAAVALCAVGGLAGACGGTAPLSRAQAGTDYLNDIAPVHSAAAAFATAATMWTLTTTNAEASADAAPLITAEENFDAALSSTAWPANATADVQTLITENKVIIADLTELSTITRAAVAGWELKIGTDTDVDAADSNLVRSDLGLPQATLAV
jgi:hypothetical protein